MAHVADNVVDVHAARVGLERPGEGSDRVADER